MEGFEGWFSCKHSEDGSNQASEKGKPANALKENEWRWKVESVTGLDSDFTELILLFLRLLTLFWLGWGKLAPH